MFSHSILGRTTLGVMASVCLCAGTIGQAATARKHLSPAAHHHTVSPRARKANVARPLPHPQTVLPPISSLPNPPMTLPYVVPPLPVVRPSNIAPFPQVYGGGGGTVHLPTGGSFGSPPLAGGSFGGGRPMGGSFGDGRIH